MSEEQLVNRDCVWEVGLPSRSQTSIGGRKELCCTEMPGISVSVSAKVI